LAERDLRIRIRCDCFHRLCHPDLNMADLFACERLMSRLLALLSVLGVFGLSGCATVPAEVRPRTSLFAPRGIVFVADGAGGGEATSVALHRALEEERVPLAVETFKWSHGYARYFADQRDREYARERGRELATLVAAYRGSFPNNQIYVVAHSAGACVALDAAEALSPGSIDRIVLLSPSVAADRDLRPALRAVRDSLDVFCSREDWFYLGIGTGVVGTVEGPFRDAAGRVGFRPKMESSDDIALYCKLRQHPWNRAVAWTGNQGGHYGGHADKYLRAYVVPLLSARCP
jgi:pimeloyl-ACP methyl ester carboxylesterase